MREPARVGQGQAPSRLGHKRQRSNSPEPGPSKHARLTSHVSTRGRGGGPVASNRTERGLEWDEEGGDSRAVKKRRTRNDDDDYEDNRGGPEEGKDAADEDDEEEGGEEGEKGGKEEDKYALKNQRVAVNLENEARSLTCDFCSKLPDGTGMCDRQIIDGWVIECTMCADHRLQSGDLDHKCFRSGQHEDVEVFKRYSRYHRVEFPKNITCEECKINGKLKDSRCDADPWLQLRCTGCMKTKDSESKLCVLKVSTDEEDLGWGFEVERQMGPKPNLQRGRSKWFRRECDICKSKPQRDKGPGCSWLSSRETEEPGEPRQPCLQCQDGKMSCFDSGVLIGHPSQLELPTAWSTKGDLDGGWVELRGDKDFVTRPQCKQCRAQKRHCRASAKYAEYACNWCWQTGMVCQDIKDENKIYPLFDLSRVGIGNFCPFARCTRCEETGRNCDRQRPCDSCFFNGEGDQCDKWHLGSLGTLNCLDRRINEGASKMEKPGPLYYLSMGYGPTGVDDEKDGSQIEHYIGPPFARYAFNATANRRGAVSRQSKQSIVAEIQKMRKALTAKGVPPNGAPGGELYGVNVNEVTVAQLRLWMANRWPHWTRQCDNPEYKRHRDSSIISKSWVRLAKKAVAKTRTETGTGTDTRTPGEESEVEEIPDSMSFPRWEAVNTTENATQSGDGALVRTAAPIVTSNNAALAHLPGSHKGWWNQHPDLPGVPSGLLSGEARLPLTLFEPNSSDIKKLYLWNDLVKESEPPSETALLRDYCQNPIGSTNFGLFSIVNGAIVRHSPINQVLEGISWSSSSMQIDDIPCMEQASGCHTFTQIACQDKKHMNPHQAVCGPCGVGNKSYLLHHADKITKLDILGMRAYFCDACHHRLTGGPRSISELYLLGAKNISGCQFQNNTVLDGNLNVNGRQMGFSSLASPITGCTCGGGIFSTHMCLADRVKYARYCMYQAQKMRNWRARKSVVGLSRVRRAGP
ncbi:hypothetical protein ED733_008377 [Metarhizium rileyi]|uniref:Uncharacterized protein n=1 Tax=Metarhizium rileyi (strain RCEF 4871) TaxID=1649241 RepID=A0A5C6GHA3_METRR|nr:hypothetical protein ED733_008377 [Metarhizium rileyi]